MQVAMHGSRPSSSQMRDIHVRSAKQVFFRLNEVDHMLDLVQQEAVGVGEARALVQGAKLKVFAGHAAEGRGYPEGCACRFPSAF